MSCALPQEILDLIVGHLHDKPTTVETYCIVSRSWVPRMREHLSVCVKFDATKIHRELWKKIFPDPCDSPAHHTRRFVVYGVPVVTAGVVGSRLSQCRALVFGAPESGGLPRPVLWIIARVQNLSPGLVLGGGAH